MLLVLKLELKLELKLLLVTLMLMMLFSGSSAVAAERPLQSRPDGLRTDETDRLSTSHFPPLLVFAITG